MLKNKKRDMTPFNMSERPCKPYWFLMPIVWLASFLATRKFHLKIEKINMKKVKPPFLVLATHQGFSDYYIGPLALFPHRGIYVSDMEGFAAFGKWLYRGLGCIGKRRYVADISVINNLRYAVRKKQSIVIYPESRHSNIGITSVLPKNLGALAKFFKLPVVIISGNGSYLANPFWDEGRTRRVPIKVKMECICDTKELEMIDALVLQKRIVEELSYDEYRYQHNNKILIKEKYRAEGIEHALYKCIECNAEGRLWSKGSRLGCNNCKTIWELTTTGWLEKQSNDSLQNEETSRIHIPDWYSFEQKAVVQQLSNSDINMQFKVRIDALPNEKGFVDLGEGILRLNSSEFALEFGETILRFPHVIRQSLQTEYNYRGRGECVVLSTKDCCYYLYSEDEFFIPTKLQFIAEYYYSIRA